MRIHYYQFPDTVNAQTRFLNGAEAIGGGECRQGRESCRNCPESDDGWQGCPHFLVADAADTLAGVSISRAKKLLRQFGGSAWTAHIERDGGLFETTAITLGGNNSRHKYNRHL